MSEYIRRSDALAQAAFMHGRWDDTYVSSEKLKAIPAVDAAVVTRCKDCKWDRPDVLLDKHWCFRFLGSMEVRGDDFCSYGEPKEVR